jgi:hypothetical protein
MSLMFDHVGISIFAKVTGFATGKKNRLTPQISHLLPYAARMKIKHGRTEPKLLKNSQGQYELIGGTEEDIEAAKQWASFWVHEMVCRSRCRRSIPPLLKYQRHTLFVRLRSRVKF